MTSVVSLEMLVVVVRGFGGDDKAVEMAETVVLVMIVNCCGSEVVGLHGFQC